MCTEFVLLNLDSMLLACKQVLGYSNGVIFGVYPPKFFHFWWEKQLDCFEFLIHYNNARVTRAKLRRVCQKELINQRNGNGRAPTDFANAWAPKQGER